MTFPRAISDAIDEVIAGEAGSRAALERAIQDHTVDRVEEELRLLARHGLIREWRVVQRVRELRGVSR
jgi:hypothetical protein